MATCTVLFKKLYKILRHNQFFFQNVQNNEIFEIFKMVKNNSWINFYYLEPLDCLSCFQLEIPFFDKFGPKTLNY